jgi:hypothetical protein
MRRTVIARLCAAGALLLTTAGLQLAAAGPATASPGLVFASAVSALDSSSPKEAAAACPAGKRVLGGGGYIEGGGRRVQFQRLQPSGSFDVYYAGAVEVSGGYAGNWRVHAYAICAAQPAGLEYVSFHTGTSSSSSRTATATCPGTKKVVGLGARVSGGGGQVMLDDMAPNAALTSVTATAYEDDNGYAGNWSLWAYAVCANPLPGLELRTATSASDSFDKGVFVPCPVGKRVHGVGGMMNGATGQALYGGVYPNATLTSTTAISVEDSNGYAGNWSVTTFAVCAI